MANLRDNDFDVEKALNISRNLVNLGEIRYVKHRKRQIGGELWSKIGGLKKKCEVCKMAIKLLIDSFDCGVQKLRFLSL